MVSPEFLNKYKLRYVVNDKFVGINDIISRGNDVKSS